MRQEPRWSGIELLPGGRAEDLIWVPRLRYPVQFLLRVDPPTPLVGAGMVWTLSLVTDRELDQILVIPPLVSQVVVFSRGLFLNAKNAGAVALRARAILVPGTVPTKDIPPEGNHGL